MASKVLGLVALNLFFGRSSGSLSTYTYLSDYPVEEERLYGFLSGMALPAFHGTINHELGCPRSIVDLIEEAVFYSFVFQPLQSPSGAREWLLYVLILLSSTYKVFDLSRRCFVEKEFTLDPYQKLSKVHYFIQDNLSFGFKFEWDTIYVFLQTCVNANLFDYLLDRHLYYQAFFVLAKFLASLFEFVEVTFVTYIPF